jgi:Asp-tRNA(Asn)/Glu-tRNA(Gln) amidotransferase A subunit family amidase
MKNVIGKRLLPALLATGLISGCTTSLLDRADHSSGRAFIKYWPPPKNDTSLRLAVKDLIDVQGVVTSAGSQYIAKNSPPATQDAECLRIARQRGVRIVGKTNLTELAVTVSGQNKYFGTPINRNDGKSKVIPGGSSSGSAVAIETNLADVAFGTDSGGSIRVPAACCGIYGLKTTFGLISTKGVFPIAPKHLDTVGPMARDIPRLVLGMDLLQEGFAFRYQAAVAAKPSARQIRIGRFYVGGTSPAIDKAIDDKLKAKGFQVVKLKPAFKKKWEQAEKDGKTVALAGSWINNGKYVDQKGINTLTKLVLLQGEWEYTNHYKAAVKRKARWQRDLDRVFDRVDFIALPTLQNLPPKLPWFGADAVFEWMVFNMQNTIAVNYAGNPALAVPIAMPPQGKRTPVTSLQLIGPRKSEAELVNAGRLLQ